MTHGLVLVLAVYLGLVVLTGDVISECKCFSGAMFEFVVFDHSKHTLPCWDFNMVADR